MPMNPSPPKKKRKLRGELARTLVDERLYGGQPNDVRRCKELYLQWKKELYVHQEVSD